MTYRRIVFDSRDAVADAAFDHEAAALETIRRFARADLVGAVLAIVFVATANGLAVRSDLLWIVPPALAALAIALVLATRSVDAGRLLPAIALITGGNWLVATVVPFALPFLWPILVLVVVMPLVLAAPLVPLRALVGLILAAAAVAAGVALVGLESDDGGAIPDINDELELVVVVGALAAMMAPIGLVVWLNHRNQRLALDAALTLNAELERSRRELTDSRRRVVEAGDAARSRIERDLHDGAQQRLVALGMSARLLASRIDRADEPLVERLVSEVDAAVDELRELAHGIYPPVLEAHGLGEALQAAARRSPERIVIANGIGTDRLPRHVEEALYFTGLEAMANASKHATGSEIRVVIGHVDAAVPAHGGRRVELRIEDGGPGFDPADAIRSHGLANMRDRIETLGGSFSIDSSPAGSVVRATVDR